MLFADFWSGLSSHYLFLETNKLASRRMYVYVYQYTSSYNMYMCIYIWYMTCIYIYVYIYMCIYIYFYVCMYTYVYTALPAHIGSWPHPIIHQSRGSKQMGRALTVEVGSLSHHLQGLIHPRWRISHKSLNVPTDLRWWFNTGQVFLQIPKPCWFEVFCLRTIDKIWPRYDRDVIGL